VELRYVTGRWKQIGLEIDSHAKLYSKFTGLDLAERLESLAVNASVATALGSNSASADTVASKGGQMKQ